MQFKFLLVSMVSTAIMTQAAAFPAFSKAAIVAKDFHGSTRDISTPYSIKTRNFDLYKRDSTNAAKHEADEQKDNASAEQKEAKEQEDLAKADAAAKAGDSAQAAKESQKADEEEGREQTAKAHADAAEAKEQAAKANEK